MSGPCARDKLPASGIHTDPEDKSQALRAPRIWGRVSPVAVVPASRVMPTYLPTWFTPPLVFTTNCDEPTTESFLQLHRCEVVV